MSPALSVALLVVAAAAPVTEESPPEQTLLFYNARLALRQSQPTEVLRLWLLRNRLANQGQVSRHDEEFRSVVWAALGDLGLCQDGYPTDDEGGAGLWPLALHNWVVHAAGRGKPPGRQAPFDAFEVSRQRRFVSLHDLLDASELRSVSFYRSKCSTAKTVLLTDFETPSYNLNDRLFTALLLRRLLRDSLETLDRNKVESVAAVEARIFDLDLVLAEMRSRQGRREALEQKRRAKALGISEQGALEAQRAIVSRAARAKEVRFLRRSLEWQPFEWFNLTRERRLFVFSRARQLSEDPAALDGLMLAIIDELIARREGDELELWLGFFAAGSSERRRVLTEGERGKRLLALDPESRFRERSPVALHRGVAQLERGERQEALRSFAFAMSKADESGETDAVMALSRRWLSFVLARFQTNDELIATLKALVPRQEYNAVVEDLIWSAALRADSASFERVAASLRRGGAFDLRVERLRPLSRGDAGELMTKLRDAAADEPHFTLRFLRQLIERIEVEEANVRAANAPMLHLVSRMLDEFAGEEGRHKSHIRIAEELSGRVQAILEGLGHLELSIAGKARGMSPGHEAFAGNVRLAPGDALPWPFKAPEPEPPSAFVPLTLTPVEWRDAKGELVFGWRLTE